MTRGYPITIRATDSKGATFDKEFFVEVTDVDEEEPSNPLPDDGTADVDDAASFEVLPTATVVDGGVKLHGKKAANGSAGKFIYDFEDFAANTTLVMKYSADWSLLSNDGKNAFVGFGTRDGNAFDLVGLRGDGTTGVHKVRMHGTNPNGWSQLSGHTVSDGGAPTNGTQSGPNWIALAIRSSGAAYDFFTSADGSTWSSEYSNQVVGAVASLIGNDVDGIAAVFAGTDTGPFSFNVLDYHVVPAPTITSTDTGNVAENATLSHALTANQTVTWSIVGGADQAKFEINGGSTLRFAGNATKDYEAPDDADANNTYVVTVRATNSFGSATDQTITATVTDDAADNLWTPVQLGAARLAHYDTTLLTGTNGDALSSLPDQAGNVNLTQSGGARPTLAAGHLPSGLNSFRCTAASTQRFPFPSLPFTGKPSGSIFFVWRVVNEAANNGLFKFGSSGDESHWPFSDGAIYDDFGSTARKSVGNPTPSLQSYRMIGITSAANAWNFYIDDGDAGKSGGATPLAPFFTTASNTVGWGGAGWAIGASASLLAGDCYCGPFLLVDGVPTDTVRHKIFGYLAHLCGLTGNLDGTHPYKSTPPTI